jgi:hypothetical protein
MRPSPRCRPALLAVLAPLALAALSLAACGNSARPSRDPTPPDGTATSTAEAAASAPASPASAGSASASGQASAAPPSDAGAPNAAADDAGASAPPPSVVADNKVSPTEGPELQERAKALFEAIVKDEPERAESFWFPREPFIPLKDIKDPGKYWDQLHRTYAKDVHALHKKRKSWDGAEFVSFGGWARTKWVPPGDEANKIGYYRAFDGKLRFRQGDKDGSLDVHVIITWQGRWYITHLRKFR